MERQRAGTLPTKQRGEMIFRIADMRIVDDYVSFLFRLADPDVPDSTVENANDQSIRVLERGDDEAPAFSAHGVVDIGAVHDVGSAYPMVLENVDHLSRSLVFELLSSILAELFTEERPRDDGGELVEYSPRIEIRGHQSQTVRGILNSGGTLSGVRFVTTKTQENAFGDEAYATNRYSEIKIDITGRPSGERATNWLSATLDNYLDGDLREAKVIVEDLSGRSKTTKLDLRRDDILSNFFISQTLLNGFDAPLETCDQFIREDMIQKMIEALPN